MKFFSWRKDGGQYSHVTGLFFIEIKSLFSIVLLRFADGSRDAFHSHAFNSWNWVLTGEVSEHVAMDRVAGPLNHGFVRAMKHYVYTPSLWPVFTPRSRMHKVVSRGTTWVLSFRGPWADTWEEFLPAERRYVTLTHGRKEVQ